MLLIYIGVYPDGAPVMQRDEIPFLTRIKFLSAIHRHVYLSRISVATRGIHLIVSAVFRIDTWLEGDDTALNVRVLFQQLPTETIHDFRSVQPFLYCPVPAARSCLHLIQGVVDAQLRRALCLTGFLHGLLIDGLAGMVEHDEEGGDEESGHESHYPQHDLRGQLMA